MSLFPRNAAALFGAALMVLGATAGSIAQDAAATTPQAPAAPPSWVLECSSPNAATGPLDCQMTQRFVRQESGAVLMVVSVVRTAADGQMSLHLILPHGLFLPAGVSYQIDANAKQTAPITSSSQNGALASIPLPPELLTMLKGGTTLTISMETATHSPIGIPVSLAGFTAAVDRLSSVK